MTGIEEAWNLLEEEQNVKHKWCDTPEEAVEKVKELIDALGDDIEIYSGECEDLGREEAKRYIEQYAKCQENKVNLDFCYKDTDGKETTSTLWIECWGLSGGDADMYVDMITFVR